jgi:polyphosphate kinase
LRNRALRVTIPAMPAPRDALRPPFLNPELSLLRFQHRVLALATDPDTPLVERLRFLGIVASNIDEFYMVRMAELRLAASDAAGHREAHHDGWTARSLLLAVEDELAALAGAQRMATERCLHDARLCGVSIARWAELGPASRAVLTKLYRQVIQPQLAPLALTQTPGVPLPHLPHFGLFLGVVHRADAADRPHLVELELPADVPRLLPVPRDAGVCIPIEEVLRANAASLYPSGIVDGAYLFRVTRGGDLTLSADAGDDLLTAVSSAAAQRPYNPAVRVEVESEMPMHVRSLILHALRRDAHARDQQLTVQHVERVHGLLDARCLSQLPLPQTPPLTYPTLQPAPVVPVGHSWLTQIAAREQLVHHPFASFDDSVVRFFTEAADDPSVTRICATLYRVGTPSPVVEALVRAAARGVQVLALIELQARFDEEHNVHWARELERAGGTVVHGLPGLKVHAKLALVERRAVNDGRLRLAHIGTGNYNTRTGRQYTDLSLFTARADVTDDLHAVFEAFAQRAVPASSVRGALLIAPDQLLPALRMRIAREISNARAGRPAAITIKVNGLADREIVSALYEASAAGVRVDLFVRGICTLRPGVPGLSENVRVVTTVGRWLEHSRIYRFRNDETPEYLIGSSDLRPRNLRRRVEVLVAVTDVALRAQLDGILDRYLTDPSAWELQPDGSYRRRAVQPGALSAQSWFALSSEVTALS